MVAGLPGWPAMHELPCRGQPGCVMMRSGDREQDLGMRQRGPHLVQLADGASSPRGEGDSGGAELADVISRLRRAMRRAADVAAGLEQ